MTSSRGGFKVDGIGGSTKSSSAGMCAGRSITVPDSWTSSAGRDDDAFATGGCLGVDAPLAAAVFLAFGCGCSFGAALAWAGATAGAFGGVTGAAAFGGVTGTSCPLFALFARAAFGSEDRFFAKGTMLSDELDDVKPGTACTVASSWLEGCGNTGDVTVLSANRAFFVQHTWAPCLPPHARPVLDTTAQTWASGHCSSSHFPDWNRAQSGVPFLRNLVRSFPD